MNPLKENPETPAGRTTCQNVGMWDYGKPEGVLRNAKVPKGTVADIYIYIHV